MRWTRWPVAAATGFCLVLGVGACGDDNSVSSEDRDAITAAIERAATSGDPKACVDVQTQHFTEQTTGKKGREAIKQCRNDADDSADKVEVSNIEVDGASGSADTAITGSFLDGQEVAIGLVKQGDTWKLDAFKNFVGGFDREAFYATLKREFAKEKDIPPGTAACVQKNVAKLSEAQIDDLFINSDPKVEKQVFEPCFSQ